MYKFTIWKLNLWKLNSENTRFELESQIVFYIKLFWGKADTLTFVLSRQIVPRRRFALLRLSTTMFEIVMASSYITSALRFSVKLDKLDSDQRCAFATRLTVSPLLPTRVLSSLTEKDSSYLLSRSGEIRTHVLGISDPRWIIKPLD